MHSIWNQSICEDEESDVKAIEKKMTFIEFDVVKYNNKYLEDNCPNLKILVAHFHLWKMFGLVSLALNPNLTYSVLYYDNKHVLI